MAAEHRWGRASMRLRTTAAAALIVLVALTLGTVALVVVLRHQLVDDLDASIRARADDIASLVDSDVLPRSLPRAGEDAIVVQVVDGTGTVVAQSSDLDLARPIATIDAPSAKVATRTIEHPPVGDGAAYRVVVRPTTLNGEPATIIAAGSLEPIGESTAAVRNLLALGIPLVTMLVAAVTWVVVGRALGPVEAIRQQVAQISATALDRRVPSPLARDEIGRLAETMNDMLERLDTAARRQRAFVADASHELRSPLAAVQTELDVAAAHPGATDWAAVAGRLRAQNQRLQQMVEDLLSLAAADEQRAPRAPRPVDLDELALRAVEPVRARGRVAVDLSGVEGGRVMGDQAQLSRLITNLVDNAERHAASRVAVELHTVDHQVVLAVSDDGDGIVPADRERIFDRFTRLDEARDRRSGGAGLGLAIAREIAGGHRGTLAVEDSDVGARLVLRLPRAE